MVFSPPPGASDPEVVDYDYDSEAEWEPEPEDGDDCVSADELEEEDGCDPACGPRLRRTLRFSSCSDP